jgi:hypothetical protein
MIDLMVSQKTLFIFFGERNEWRAKEELEIAAEQRE